MKKPTAKVRVAASVVVHQIPNMTEKGRRIICQWLRKLAKDIQNEPDAFAKTFRARYFYTPEKSDDRA